MARSRRKTPIMGLTTAPSEKADKRISNRLTRHKIRIVLHNGSEVEVLPQRKEIFNSWSLAKDGKIYWGSRCDPKFMRK
jgi:hypothetical protein